MDRKLKIFDMDSTLVQIPDFSDFIKGNNGDRIVNTDFYMPEHFKIIKGIFWDVLMKEVFFVINGNYIVPLNTLNKWPFDDSDLEMIYEKNPKAKNYLELYNGTIVIKHPPGFYSDPDTLGYSVNEPVFKEYLSSKNNMILTGRDEKLRPNVLRMLKYLHIPEPNQGLFLWPGKSIVKKDSLGKNEIMASNIKEYKAYVILEALSSGKWNEVHFYEDREDWLNYAEGVVVSKYPNVKFVGHHITNLTNQKQM